jgi:DnaA family protein
MRQMLLDLPAEKPQTLDTFVAGRNAELMALLRRIAARDSTEHFVYLWGEAGSGKSHLLHSLESRPFARRIPVDAPTAAFRLIPECHLYLIDDCDKLPADNQIAAFNLYNEVREHGATLVTSGAVAPAVLAVREDLRTRLGWGLIYQVHGLSDEEKIAALTQAAQARGLSISAGVLPWLLTHYKRDMRSLAAMLDGLDRYSLETKRPITLPLLRSLLQQEAT